MAIEVSDVERVSSLVSDLARRDVSDLSHGDLMEAHDAVARLGRLAGTLQARFAGEIARRSAPDLPGGGLARRQGFGNAGLMVSRVTGGTAAGAMRAIEAGLALMPDAAPSVGLDASDQTDSSQFDAPQASVSPTPRYPA